MDIHAFKDTLKEQSCPQNLPPLLKALWLTKNDEWDQAHNLVDGIPSTEASWIHALLHRIEGDKWNAGYWYRRAGRKFPEKSIDEEWEEIAEALT